MILQNFARAQNVSNCPIALMIDGDMERKTLSPLGLPACNTEAKQAMWAYACHLHKHPKGFFFP